MVKCTNGFIFLIKLIHGIFLGDFIKNFALPIKLLKKIFLGSKTFLSCLNLYFLISNLSNLNSSKITYIKSSGTYAQIIEIKKTVNLILLKFPSGLKKFFHSSNICNIGRNSNIDHKYSILAKASFHINLGRKPDVRGVAKNPVDHPHGGRTKTNKPEVSP